MRVATRYSRGNCFACGKEIHKQFVMNLGSAAVTFNICRSCAKKLAQGLVRELNKKEETT